MTDSDTRPRRRIRASTATAAAAPPEPAPLAGKATINDIARLAGVSKKTVSRVINDSPLVRPETREKVAALMQQLGYSPDPQARGLAFRRSFLIGMVYDNPTAQYIVNMQYGALDALRDSGYELVVHPCDSRSDDYIDGVRRFVQQQKLHGVILMPRVSEDEALADGAARDRLPLRAHRRDPARRRRAAWSSPTTATARQRSGQLPRIARPPHARPDHRPAPLPVGARARRRLPRGLAERGIELPPDYIVRGRLHLRVRRRRCRVPAAPSRRARPRSSPATTKWPPACTRRRMRRGLSIPGDLSVVGLRRQPAGVAAVAGADHDPPADPRHGPPGRADAAEQRAGANWRVPRTVTPQLVVRESCQRPQG